MAHDWTQITNVERALQSLAGIAQGIALDCEINDAEVSSLTEWLSMYSELLNRQPFKELADLLSRILADGRIDELEREELLDRCQRFSSSSSMAIRTSTNALRRLHGVLHGIAADGVVTEQELIDLEDWLQDYDELLYLWPFCDLQALLHQIRIDRIVSDRELAELLAFCQPFVERAAPGGHSKPVGHTLTGICDHGAQVDIPGSSFLFTGKASRVRAQLHDAVAARGGVALDRVRQDLNYLVVGSLSQPAWAYAAYGRKIEAVLALRQVGFDVKIIHEHVFLEALT